MSKLNQNNMFSNLFNNNPEETPKDLCVNNVIDESSLKTIKNNEELTQISDNKQKLQEKRDYLKKKLEEKKLEGKK